MLMDYVLAHLWIQSITSMIASWAHHQHYLHGRVNHVVAEETQNTSGVVLGMFPVNSNPATILFDSRGSDFYI